MHLPHLFPLLLLATTVCSEIQSREDLYARLVGFDGCNYHDKEQAIKAAWQQSWDVMDVIRDLDIDWNEAAALEFLGPPGYNKPFQDAIQQIVNNLGMMNGTWVELLPDWAINVRCDDWAHRCSAMPIAYTDSRGPTGLATINFCNFFFYQPDLSNQVSRGENEKDHRWKYDVENYEGTKGETLRYPEGYNCHQMLTNLAVTFLHELLQIDWVYRGGRYGRNRAVVDFDIELWDETYRKKSVVSVNGSRNAKILARWFGSATDPNTGDIIARSAESLALYSLAKYLTAHFGAYPHHPLVKTNPTSKPPIPIGELPQPLIQIVANNKQVFLDST